MNGFVSIIRARKIGEENEVRMNEEYSIEGPFFIKASFSPIEISVRKTCDFGTL